MVEIYRGRDTGAVQAEVLAGAQAVAKVALDDADTGGGIAAWLNPTGESIIVTNVLLLLTTGGSDLVGYNDIAKLGVAPNATTAGEQFTPGSGYTLDWDVVPVVAKFVNIDPRRVLAGEYVTLSTRSGTAAGIVGYAYIYYHPAS